MSEPAQQDERPALPPLVVPRGVVPFHLPRHPVRGRLVRLGPIAQLLLTRASRPRAVTALLGEALALTAALATALKFAGSFSLHAQGDGPVRMLLADCTDTGALRGTLEADEKRLAALLAATPSPGAAALLGAGRLAFTVDQGPDAERHQGLVALEGGTLAEMASHYFATSEQLPVWLRLTCAPTQAGWRASALILERIAATTEPEAAAEGWRTATTLAATATEAELLDDALTPEALLWRLFGAEGVAVTADRPLASGCRCSRRRLASILESFSTAELDDMTVDGEVVMHCHFCAIDFRFPRAALRGNG